MFHQLRLTMQVSLVVFIIVVHWTQVDGGTTYCTTTQGCSNKPFCKVVVKSGAWALKAGDKSECLAEGPAGTCAGIGDDTSCIVAANSADATVTNFAACSVCEKFKTATASCDDTNLCLKVNPAPRCAFKKDTTWKNADPAKKGCYYGSTQKNQCDKTDKANPLCILDPKTVGGGVIDVSTCDTLCGADSDTSDPSADPSATGTATATGIAISLLIITLFYH